MIYNITVLLEDVLIILNYLIEGNNKWNKLMTFNLDFNIRLGGAGGGNLR